MSPRRQGRGRGAVGLVLAGAVVAVVLGVVSAPAYAHAALVASQPEPGSELATTPGVVVLRFSEPVIADLSGATVGSPGGQRFEGEVTGEREIRVRLATNETGVYLVDWKTVSPLDGHTLRGRFAFGVGVPVDAAELLSLVPGAADLAVAAVRAVEYAALLAALGLLVWWRTARDDPRLLGSVPLDRLPPVAAAALAAGLVVVAGELLLAAGSLRPRAWQGFLLAPSGVPRLARLAGEAVAVGAAVARRPAWTAAGLVTALVGLAAAGHAGAVEPRWWGVVASGGHLVAAGVWAGGILAMLLVRPPGDWRGGEGKRLLERFSPAAIGAFWVTVAFGVVRASQELSRVGDLLTTAYGRALLAKVALVAAMVPLSLRAWRRRQAAPRTESLLALGAVAAAAVLAAFPLPPQRAAETARAVDDPVADTAFPQPGDLTLGGETGEVLVGLTLRLGGAGINDVYVHLLPIGGPDAAAPLEATLSVDGRPPRTMERCGAPCRVATVTVQGGEVVEVDVAGAGGGTASFALPEQLPAADGTALLERLVERMNALDSYRYDETLGPADPPVVSTWEVEAPDRLWGRVEARDATYETLRIEDRRWRRDLPDGDWEGGEPGGRPLRLPFHIWNYPGPTAVRIVGADAVDGVPTEVLSFFVEVGSTPIWYRLWVEDDGLVHRAEMRAQGHFMDHRYDDFDLPLDIQPPPGHGPPGPSSTR